jgi:hypothetical protein
MSAPVVNLVTLKSLLGTLEFDCAVCHEPITRDDFAADQVIAMTGPKRAVAAHLHHFFTPDRKEKTSSYDRNMKRVGFAYCVQNNLPLSGGYPR